MKSQCHISVLAVAGLAGLVAAGCRSIGPRTIPRDRFDYSAALADSWKNQMLLNIVKTRYLDLPIYLDVGQIVCGYRLETSANVGGAWYDKGGQVSPGNTLTLGGAARFADSPTITYTPLTGEKFLEAFVAPIDPAKIFSLVQTGYAADYILELSVDALNGLRNRPVTIGARREADPDFFRVLTLLREVQDAAALGLRVERPARGQPATVLFFRSDKVGPQEQAKIAEVRALLGCAPGQSAFMIVQSPVRGGSNELAVATRSLSQIVAALAAGVEVPPVHLARKLVPPVAAPFSDREHLLRVHSGAEEPDGAFVAVPYDGQWFWIANDDWRSKRTFSSILFLFTLANTGAPQSLPVLTIPTQ